MLGTLWPCTTFIFHSHTTTGNLFIAWSDMVTCCWIYCTVKVNNKVPKKKLERTFSVFITITLHQQCLQEAIDFKYFWKYLGVLSSYKITSKLTSMKWSCRTFCCDMGPHRIVNFRPCPQDRGQNPQCPFCPIHTPQAFSKNIIY